jgi:hypothetical protein
MVSARDAIRINGLLGFLFPRIVNVVFRPHRNSHFGAKSATYPAYINVHQPTTPTKIAQSCA